MKPNNSLCLVYGCVSVSVVKSTDCIPRSVKLTIFPICPLDKSLLSSHLSSAPVPSWFSDSELLLLSTTVSPAPSSAPPLEPSLPFLHVCSQQVLPSTHPFGAVWLALHPPRALDNYFSTSVVRLHFHI
jgi:hypothetical protein